MANILAKKLCYFLFFFPSFTLKSLLKLKKNNQNPNPTIITVIIGSLNAETIWTVLVLLILFHIKNAKHYQFFPCDFIFLSHNLINVTWHVEILTKKETTKNSTSSMYF